MSAVLIRHLAAFLVAVALLAKVSVPAGWMPVSDDGVARIVLCTGEGRIEVWVDENGEVHRQSPNEGGHDGDEPPCPFTAAATPTDVAPSSDALAAPTAIPALLDDLPFEIIPGRGLAAPPPPATGPPLLA